MVGRRGKILQDLPPAGTVLGTNQELYNEEILPPPARGQGEPGHAEPGTVTQESALRGRDVRSRE